MRRIAAGGIVCLALALPTTANAATYGVTNTADTPIGAACFGFANCSLRGAVNSANANPGSDSILVESGTYSLTNGQIPITGDLEISRVGAGASIVDGGSASRLFDVTGIGTDLTVTFMTLQNGSVTSPGPAYGGAIRAAPQTSLTIQGTTIKDSDVFSDADARGGAIYSEGAVTIGKSNLGGGVSSITGNTASSTTSNAIVQGGGVATGPAASSLTVKDGTRITGNAVTGHMNSFVSGGGVYADTGATLTNTTVDSNTVTGGGPTGGGVTIRNGTGQFLRSTVSRNVTLSLGSQQGGGGGVVVPSVGNASLDFKLSTVANNSVRAAAGSNAGPQGGAIASFPQGGSVSILNSTIAKNDASTLGAGATASVGGIYTNSGTITAGGAILAENTQTNGLSIQCQATSLTSSGYNVFGTIGFICGYAAGTGDVADVTDAGLKALADNGGDTETMMIKQTSPALDRIPAANSLCTNQATDQRGTSRPQGTNCDTGSVEAKPATLTITPDPRSFPVAPVGGSSTATVLISNSGELDTASAPSPTVAAPFSYDSGCTSPVAAGSSCTMTLKFTPTATGPASQTLTVTSGTLSDTATLNGTGVTAPDTQIDSAPADPSNQASPSFTYSGTVDASSTLDHFECSLDSPSFTTCPSSGFTASGLMEGVHTFKVRAVDSNGIADPSPASYMWTVDLTLPDTQINGGPANGSVTSDNDPAFSFSSHEANVTFKCKLDNESFADCGSTKSYTDLATGPHTLTVKAVDLAGNEDPNPVSRSWTIARPTTKRCSAPTIWADPAQAGPGGVVTTVGTSGDDVIVGTPGPDDIDGGDGNDVICALGTADVVDGGEGDDVVSLGKGADEAMGSAGADKLRGRIGPDTLLGGDGPDRLAGNSGDDDLRGEAGPDEHFGGKGQDTCVGGPPADDADLAHDCERVRI